MCAIMWSLYVDYSRSALGHNAQYVRNICSREYASNVKCMYTSTPGHIVHCSEFISGIYTDIVVSHMCT